MHIPRTACHHSNKNGGMFGSVIPEHKHGMCDGQKRQIEGADFVSHVHSHRCLGFFTSTVCFDPMQLGVSGCECAGAGEVISFAGLYGKGYIFQEIACLQFHH